jgi:hypothetical protein
MGSALGAELGAVRVHDDPAAASLTQALGARALAVGSHVAFAPNQYEPGTPLGDALIAHELAHVIQQRGAGELSRAVDPDASLEADADTAARSAVDVLYGGPGGRRGLGPALRSGLSLQRCNGTKTPTPTVSTAGAGPDLLAGTHAATADQHAHVEAILHPGSTVVAGPVGVPPVVHPPPAMTGAGVGKAFEKEMLATLKAGVHGWAAAFNALKAKGPPAFPIAQAHDIAKAAQDQVENHFGPLIQSASREPGDLYHPGAFDLSTVLGDESTRAIDDGTRQGWTHYWMTLSDLGQPVLDKYHCLEDRDTAEFNRVLEKYALDPANKADIDDAIHSWPAEAGTATVFIQPYTDADPKKLRENRWDLFTTLIHEMMHKVAHPNFEATSTAVGGTAQKYMTEGFADLMRHDVWDGPSGLQAFLATPAAAPLRLKVEGAVYPYDASVIKYHRDYDEVAQARLIAAQVGMENCKAAFFLGRTELLGIGAGTSATTSLAGLSEWSPMEETDSNVYTVQAGDSWQLIADKTGVPGSAMTKADRSALPSGWVAAAGDRIRVPGIRYVHAVQGDTLASLAAQNGVTVASVAAANGFPPGSAATTVVAKGRRILIPHRIP